MSLYVCGLERGPYSPTSIVDDLFHNTPNVAIALSEVKGAELGRCLVVMCV